MLLEFRNKFLLEMTKQLIDNNTNMVCFDSFNDEYSPKAILLCPLLNKFQIHIVSHLETIYTKRAQFNNNDTFAFFLDKEGVDASSTYAEIIVNIELCGKLELTEQELLAGIAHEIGHIILYFRLDKFFYQGQEEEKYSDTFACKIGLANPLFSLLNKLINSKLYTNEQSRLMQERLLSIQQYIKL